MKPLPRKSPDSAPSGKQPWIIDVDPITLTAIVIGLLFIPLLLSGFIFH